MKYRFLVLAVFFLPIISHAEVIFSEIAWMGTEDDANNEWIEIYNFSSVPTNLAGWTLTDGGSLNIALSGTMSPHGVFVLERTDDSTLPDITADIIYTGALSNEGRTLTIKDDTGAVVNEVVGGDNWENIGGNNDLKYTAQRTRTGSWVTAEPTPGLPNAEEDAELPEPEPQQTSSGGGGGPAKRVVRDKTSEINTGLTLTVDAPKTVYVNQEVEFKVDSDGVGRTTEGSLNYFWNFGDLSTSEKKNPHHTFKSAGDYLVVVEADYKSQEAQARHEVKVLPVALRLVPVPGGVMVVNESSEEMRLDDFVLSGSKTFVFPRLSILKSGGTIMVPEVKIGSTQTAYLHDAQGALLSEHTPAARPAVAGASYTKPVAYTPPVHSNTNPKAEGTALGKESLETETVTIIKIGDDESSAEPGFFAKIFRKIGTFFGV
jgi:hypothetical protein